MSGNRIIIMLVLLLTALLSVSGWVWFHENFERRTTQERTGMDEEARRNPLLAAEMFLSRLGLEAESYSGRQYLTQPPETPGLLFVRDLGPPLPQASVEALLRWVEEGGHLVATPGDELDDGDSHPLLQRFGVTLWEDDEDGGDEVTDLALPGEEVALQIDFERQRWFEIADEDDGLSLLEADSQYLVFAWGEGRVTFISDSEVFTNQQIGKFDHARLMAHFAPERGRAWLLYSAQMPSLFALIWRSAPYLVLTLLPLGLLIIWRMARSSGPKLQTEQAGRRDLLEHLQASAEFAWRYDLRKGLLEGARKQVEKRWLNAHPALLHLDDQGRCDWLAKRTGLTASAISQALYPGEGDRGQLIKTTANLQRLLAALHPERKVT